MTAGNDRETDELVEALLVEIRAEEAAEDQRLREARELQVVPGPCPGEGLKAYSCGAYESIMCPVCFAAPLGPWPWIANPDARWPQTPAHDRRADSEAVS